MNQSTAERTAQNFPSKLLFTFAVGCWDICKETEEKKNQLTFLRGVMLDLDSLKENRCDFAMESTGKI